MEQSPSWEANRFSASREISPHFIEPEGSLFIEPEGSLPHSEVPTTCPYPETARSNPYPHILIPITLTIFCENGGLKIFAALFRSFAFSILIF